MDLTRKMPRKDTIVNNIRDRFLLNDSFSSESKLNFIPKEDNKDKKNL